jgi:hypothetical protein
MSGTPQPESAGPEIAEFGGDPVCWLHLVCDECGALNDSPSAKRCQRCGRLLVATDRAEGAE